ncbi:hypothetical protein FHX45_000616 [Amycolatopsis granulosa]|nr:hypothetical protein [Amycolatopsis granulosa]
MDVSHVLVVEISGRTAFGLLRGSGLFRVEVVVQPMGGPPDWSDALRKARR